MKRSARSGRALGAVQLTYASVVDSAGGGTKQAYSVSPGTSPSSTSSSPFSSRAASTFSDGMSPSAGRRAGGRRASIPESPHRWASQSCPLVSRETRARASAPVSDLPPGPKPRGFCTGYYLVAPRRPCPPGARWQSADREPAGSAHRGMLEETCSWRTLPGGDPAQA